MNIKTIAVIIIILMIPAFFIYMDMHSKATLQYGEIGVESSEMYLHYGGEKSTGYAMYTNGAPSEITYIEADYYSIINLDLTNITFENNISMDQFNKDLRDFNIVYYVTFFDENDSKLESFKIKMPANPSFFDTELWSGDYNVKKTKNHKTIKLDEGVRQSIIKINDTNLVIENKGEPKDFSLTTAMEAKYAEVTLEIFADHYRLDWSHPKYSITSGKIKNINIY